MLILSIQYTYKRDFITSRKQRALSDIMEATVNRLYAWQSINIFCEKVEKNGKKIFMTCHGIPSPSLIVSLDRSESFVSRGQGILPAELMNSVSVPNNRDQKKVKEKEGGRTRSSTKTVIRHQSQKKRTFSSELSADCRSISLSNGLLLIIFIR